MVDRPGQRFEEPRTLPKATAFWVLAVLFLMLFFASAAASPLYAVYQAQFRFSAATLTAVFVVYVLVLLVTRLFFGSVSDYLGGLPVIITALVFSVAGCALFLSAHGVGALYAARTLQGIATGQPRRSRCRGEGRAPRAQRALGRRARLVLIKKTFQRRNVSLVFRTLHLPLEIQHMTQADKRQAVYNIRLGDLLGDRRLSRLS